MAKSDKYLVRSRQSARIRAAIEFQEPSLAMQAFKDECDINNIIARYVKTGVIDHVQKHGASYQDCSPVEFSEAMRLVVNAQAMFADLPAPVRAEFENEPEQFLAFVQNAPEGASLDDLLKARATHREALKRGSRSHTEAGEAAVDAKAAASASRQQPEGAA